MSYSGQLYFPCKQSQFTTVSETTYTTAVFTDTQQGVNISKANNSSHEGLATMLQAAPSTPYSVVAKLAWNAFNFNGTSIFVDPGPKEARIGLCFANGTTTSSKVKNLTVGNMDGSFEASLSPSGTAALCEFGVGVARQYSNYNTVNAGDAVYGHLPHMFGAKDIWLKLRDDGTNCIYSCSEDGFQWFHLYSEARTTYFTASYVGVVCNPFGSNTNFNVKSFQIINS